MHSLKAKYEYSKINIYIRLIIEKAIDNGTFFSTKTQSMADSKKDMKPIQNTIEENNMIPRFRKLLYVNSVNDIVVDMLLNII